MNEGLLLLRVLLASVLFIHATQKSLGWFQGLGVHTMAGAFEALGVYPGRQMVLLASILESIAAVLLLFGLITPVGALIAAATMAVAGVVSQRSAGSLWNARQGGEYPYVLAVCAVVLGFTGAGQWSLDARLSPDLAPLLGGSMAGIGVAVFAAASALLFVARLTTRGRKEPIT